MVIPMILATLSSYNVTDWGFLATMEVGIELTGKAIFLHSTTDIVVSLNVFQA